MQLQLKDRTIDLSYTMIMAIIDLDPNTAVNAEEIKERAISFKESGASFLEIGVSKDLLPDLAIDQEQAILLDALKILKDINELDLPIAVYTGNAQVMEAVVEAGADLIIDPFALHGENSLETIVKLGVPVCLCFDHTRQFAEDKDNDPCAAVSEFFYERLDTCINAKIPRNKIIFDPMLGINTSVDYRLKMLGRLKSLTSFGVPLSCAVPRVFPVADEYLEENLPACIAVCLYSELNGVKIIRTKHVYDVALSLDTWQALNQSARPFKLRNVISRKLKGLKGKSVLKKIAKKDS